MKRNFVGNNISYPYWFNKTENRHYSATMPFRDYGAPENIDNAEKLKFEEWCLEAISNNYIFNFETKISKYCLADVDILRKAYSAFRNNFIDVGESCPFTKALTMANAFSKLYSRSEEVCGAPRRIFSRYSASETNITTIN